MDYFYLLDRKKRKWYVDVTELNVDELCKLKQIVGKQNFGVASIIDKIIMERIMPRQHQKTLITKYTEDMGMNKVRRKVRRRR